MTGKRRKDRKSIKARIVPVRFPESELRVLDALVDLQNAQLGQLGLTAVATRGAVLRLLVAERGQAVGLVPRKQPSPTLVPSSNREAAVKASPQIKEDTFDPDRRSGKTVFQHIREDPLNPAKKKKRKGIT